MATRTDHGGKAPALVEDLASLDAVRVVVAELERLYGNAETACVRDGRVSDHCARETLRQAIERVCLAARRHGLEVRSRVL